VAPADAAAAEDAPRPVPIEESPLLSEPTTPGGLFDAAVLMQKLARPKLAKDYLQKLWESNPDDETLLALRDSHGPAIFLKLANNAELQPFATQLLDRINQLLRDRAADPARIDALVNELFSTGDKRRVALVSLRTAGAVAVPRILVQLANPALAERHGTLVYALVQMGPEVIPPLLGALESPIESVRVSAVEALGMLKARDAVPFLWSPAFSPSQPAGVQAAARTALGRILEISPQHLKTSSLANAVDELKRAAAEKLRRRDAAPVGEDGTVVIWTWDSEANNVVPVRVTPDAAAYYTGARLAKQAIELAEHDRQTQVLFLALSLANDAQRAGWDRPLPRGEGTAFEMALMSGRDMVLDILALAMEKQNAAAALGALDVLRQIGTRSQLSPRAGMPSPLMAALNDPDPRVQFSAAVTVLSLDPDQPFSGSQRVVEILVRALRTTSASRSVVVDADIHRGDRVATLLDQIGYPADVVQTGREGFVAATRAADVSLIVLQSNTIRWPLSQTIANLRADSRTANIPIAIFGMESNEHRVEPLTRRYARVTYILEPNSLDNMKSRIQPFLSSIQTPPISEDEHSRQAAIAVEWLARIAASHRTNVFDLRPAESALAGAIADPKLAPRAMYALSAIGSKTSQTSLLEVVVSPNQPLELRLAAGAQLAAHIQRHGLLLSDEQLVQLKNAWKKADDPELKTALATVIGTLQPDVKRVGDRLKSSADPIVVPAEP
jgi:HEAT repeat protein